MSDCADLAFCTLALLEARGATPRVARHISSLSVTRGEFPNEETDLAASSAHSLPGLASSGTLAVTRCKGSQRFGFDSDIESHSIIWFFPRC